MKLSELMPWKWDCPYCGRKFKTERGASIHISRMHSPNTELTKNR